MTSNAFNSVTGGFWSEVGLLVIRDWTPELDRTGTRPLSFVVWKALSLLTINVVTQLAWCMAYKDVSRDMVE